MATAAPLNVLVVDSDPRARGDLSAMLETCGFHPTSLEDPSRAPSAVKEGRYQMVLLDVGENERGVDVLQEIRSIDDDLCVICLTDQPSVNTAVATMKQRAFDYVSKPISGEALRPLLREAVREHGLLVNIEERLNALVGEQVRKRRHELGLTLKQLANRTALSVSLISQIELGRSAASVLSLYKLATALDVKVSFFFQSV